MAGVLVALSPCAIDAASADQSWLVTTSCAAVQALAPKPDALLEKETNGRRLATQSSDSSTAIGDTESDRSVSEMSGSLESTCSIVGHVRSLSHSPEGCRRVQDALDKVASDSERELLASEFHGHAIKAMRCPHANHVLQKCISVMPSASLQFMIDELLEQEGLVKKVATHRYGGRIVQQLLRKCAGSQVSDLSEAVLQDAAALSCHTFGNYAVNHLLEFGTAEQKYRVVRTIERNMQTIGRSSLGGGVIAAALNHAAAEDRVWIARAVLQDPGLLPHLAHGRLSHGAVSQVLSVLRGSERARACKDLMAGPAELKASRYGRKVAAHLEAVAGQ